MTVTEVAPASNGAKGLIEKSRQYSVEVEIEGVRPLLFHAWNCEAVAEKAAAKKGSETKKTDNLESYVTRDDDGFICLPATYFHGSLRDAAKSFSDPRSPRKSAYDLFEEGLAVLPDLARLGPKKTKAWQYEHKGRAVVQRSAITRTWPAFKAGWVVTFKVVVLAPTHIPLDRLLEVIGEAGALKGLGDYRPSYGKFRIKRYELLEVK